MRPIAVRENIRRNWEIEDHALFAPKLATGVLDRCQGARCGGRATHLQLAGVRSKGRMMALWEMSDNWLYGKSLVRAPSAGA
jgi:hypothetical protein